MSATTLSELRKGASQSSPLDSLLNRPFHTFDPDAYHVMQERDAELIRDNLLHGSASKEYVYSFDLKGTRVTGISVIGARQLASEYKGIKARIVASTEKRGALFIFRTFEPLGIDTRELPALEHDPDFYEIVMEISDIKTGNSIQVRKSESRTERKRDGSTFERPHYSVIAESKAYRNGVLAVLPQNVIIEFERKSLAAGNGSDEQTIDQLRQKTAAYCAKNGIPLVRGALADLQYAELRGLASAASNGVDSFRESADLLGIVATQPQQQDAPQRQEQKAPTQKQRPAPNVDKSTGEITPPSDGPTESDVFAALERAGGIDALDTAADLISAVEGSAAQDRLAEKYRGLRAEMEGAAAKRK